MEESNGAKRPNDLEGNAELERERKTHRAEQPRNQRRDRDVEPSRVRRSVTWGFGQGLSVHFQGEGKLTLLDGEVTSLGCRLKQHYAYHFTTRGVLLTCSSSTARVELDGVFTANVVVVDSSADEIAALLGAARLTASANNGNGPVVLIVGPQDTGKSTLFTTLINKALQAESLSLSVGIAAVDLDIGQSNVGCPGTISAAFVTEPIAIDDDFQSVVPLSFFFGDKSVTPSTMKRYLDCCTNLQRCVTSIAKQHTNFALGGTIINTMGWTEGLGLEILLQAINIFRVTHILVATPTVVTPDSSAPTLFDTMAHTAKSSLRGIVVRRFAATHGLFVRSRAVRVTARDRRIAEYFSGNSRLKLTPVVVTVELVPLTLLDATTGAALSPASIKPLSLVAVSRASSEGTAPHTNIAGFVVWLEAGEKWVRLLAPSSGPLPSSILLVSSTIQASPRIVPMPSR